MKTVILDNYDSFVFNLFQYVGEIDERPLVFRNDAITLDQLSDLAPQRIIISPGPGRPDDPAYFGICLAVIRHFGPKVPILGVCLGHQGIVEAFGGRVVRAAEVMHGKISQIRHDGRGVLRGLPAPFEAMRYHSLVAERETLPDCLEITAQTLDGVIMGVRHREFPIHGVQFHPESIGTANGREVLENFILGGDRLHVPSQEHFFLQATAATRRGAGDPATEQPAAHQAAYQAADMRPLSD
jgi:anthranilate synthase component II